MTSDAFLQNLRNGGGEWTPEAQRNFDSYGGVPKEVGTVIAAHNTEREADAIVAEEAQRARFALEAAPNPAYGAQVKIKMESEHVVDPEWLRAQQAAAQGQQGMESARRVAASERSGFRSAVELARRYRQQNGGWR